MCENRKKGVSSRLTGDFEHDSYKHMFQCYWKISVLHLDSSGETVFEKMGVSL